MLSFFPRDVLDELLDLIESVSEYFSYLLLLGYLWCILLSSTHSFFQLDNGKNICSDGL